MDLGTRSEMMMMSDAKINSRRDEHGAEGEGGGNGKRQGGSMLRYKRYRGQSPRKHKSYALTQLDWRRNPSALHGRSVVQ